MPHVIDIPPWSELLRACSAGRLDQSAFGIHVKLVARKSDPRQVTLALRSGHKTLALPDAYLCPCGAFALGVQDDLKIDDLSTLTGGRRATEVLLDGMRQLRPVLSTAPDAMLRTVGNLLHADMVRQLVVHACKWNLPPFALLGRSRAPAAACWHRAAYERK